MKTKLFLLCALSVLCGSFLNTGCQSSPSSYRTLKQVGDAVDTAMVIYADAVVAGQISAEDQARVEAAYNQYRAAFHLAVDAARLDLEQSAPEQVVSVALTFINLVSTLTTKPPAP